MHYKAPEIKPKAYTASLLSLGSSEEPVVHKDMEKVRRSQDCMNNTDVHLEGNYMKID